MSKREKLTPAVPDSPEAAAYLPRIPWGKLIFGLVFVTTVVIGYRLKEERKADILREQLLAVHGEQLEPAKARYRAFREKLERLVLSTEGGPGEEAKIHKRLNLSGLRAGQGLYLRLPKDAAMDREALAKAAAKMEPDAITRCLGLTAASARGIYEQGAFLDDSWLEEAKDQHGVMELRVTDEVLANHIKADMPSVLSLFSADWFLLVLQDGEDRVNRPVDVYLWDLRSEDLLLSAEVQARGALLGARIAAEGAPYTAKAPQSGSGAHDCSIASQLRALTGTGLTEVEHVPETPAALLEPTENQGTDAAAPSAKVTTEPSPPPKP